MRSSQQAIGIAPLTLTLRAAWGREPWQLLLLGVIALATRFTGLGYPATVVFDEVHWGRYFSSYFTGNYYFDVHPPLGKLIYAGWAWLWGFRPGFAFESYAAYPEDWALVLRILPALIGSLLPLIVYRLALDFGLRKGSAFLAGFLVAIDGALVDISRFVLLDPLLLTFGFGALLAHRHWSRTKAVRWLLLSGGLAGLTFSIKWTGATFLALMILFELSSLWRWREVTLGVPLLWRLLGLVLIPAILYILQFWLHFSLLDHSGTGDAFMTPAFQATLRESLYAKDPVLEPPDFWEKFLELNRMMYQANAGMTAGHPYSSKWYSWPLMLKPIYLWQGKPLERIYLLGNPVIWWGSTVAVLTLVQATIYLGARGLNPSGRWLILGWLMNVLPFMGIGRVMFIYHYLSALVFAILLLAQLVEHAPRSRGMALAIGLMALGLYGYFSPLTYGIPSDRSMFWLPSWR